MNKYRFILKFISRKQSRYKYNWSLLFPFAGVIIGCLTVALTISIMEGMEYAIFTKLKNISFPGRFYNISLSDVDEIKGLLTKRHINFQDGIEDQVMLMNGNDFRLVTIHGIEKFTEFKNTVLNSNLMEGEPAFQQSGLYIGRSLALKLDINLGDTVVIALPKQINLFTGLPMKRGIFVAGIFELEILDYDQQHIFTHFDKMNGILPDTQHYLYLDKGLQNNLIAEIKEEFPGIHYKFWEDDHSSFISAMKLEKFTYSIIGFLIIGIAGFTLMSMMSLSVIQKVPQIGILRAIGAKRMDIGKIFISQAIVTSIISSTIGIFLSLIVIQLDVRYNLIRSLFPGGLFFDFPLILHQHYIVMIMAISVILLILAGIYPSLKAASLDPVQAIGYQR